MTSRATRPSSIYSQSFLLGELARAAETMSHDEFACFHLDSLNQVSEAFSATSMTATIFEEGGDFRSSIAYNSSKIVTSYAAIAASDDFTPKSLTEPGAALFSDALRSVDQWLDTGFYRKHCTLFDCDYIIMVSYLYPLHENTKVTFAYLRPKDDNFAAALTEEYVEYVSYPFFLGWLLLFDAIDPPTLRLWLHRCVGMTLPRFRVLRALNEHNVFNVSQIADAIGLSARTVDRHIDNAFDRLLKEEGYAGVDHTGNANRILGLARAYRFFEFGTGRALRRLPRRPHVEATP